MQSLVTYEYEFRLSGRRQQYYFFSLNVLWSHTGDFLFPIMRRNVDVSFSAENPPRDRKKDVYSNAVYCCQRRKGRKERGKKGFTGCDE